MLGNDNYCLFLKLSNINEIMILVVGIYNLYDIPLIL